MRVVVLILAAWVGINAVLFIALVLGAVITDRRRERAAVREAERILEAATG